MRQLDLQQRIEMVLPESTLAKIQATIGKKFEEEKPTIKDLLLYASITETEGQKQENMLYCLQKLENIVQQFILDKLYQLDVEQERELFAKTAYLFEKNVAVDLYIEYAHERKSIQIGDYLNTIRNTLLGPLKGVISEKEINFLRNQIDNEVLTNKTLRGIEPKIDVSHSFNPDELMIPLANRNSETSRLQVKQQEQVSEQQRVQQRDSMNLYLNQVESRRGDYKGIISESPFSSRDFFSPNFGDPYKIWLKDMKVCWRIDDALNLETDRKPKECRFDDGLIITNHGAMVQYDELSLLGPLRKKPWPIVVICDEMPEGRKRWKVVLGSVADGKDFHRYMTEEFVEVKGRTMWMVRANGKMIVGPSPLDIDADPQLTRLMTQALFFTGDFETLSDKPWGRRIEQWLDSMDDVTKQGWIHFFEEEILMGTPPGYSSSNLYKIFHP
jgi:hypothetical protein